MTGFFTLGRSLTLLVPLAIGMTTTRFQQPEQTGAGGGAVSKPTPAAQADQTRSGPPASQEPSLSWVTLDVTLYQLTIEPNRLSSDDIATLTTQTRTQAEFEKALSAIGKAAPVQRICRIVPADGTREICKTGGNVPIKSPAVGGPGGGSSIQYQQVGLNLDTRIFRADRSGPYHLTLNAEVADVMPTSVSTADDVYTPQFLRLNFAHHAGLASGASTACSAFGAAVLTNENKAVGYVIRTTITEAR